MATLLNSLLFVHGLYFVSAALYRVKYSEHVVKWCSDVAYNAGCAE